MKKRIYTIILSAIALFVLANATFAWISKNKDTSSTGMGMTIQAVNDVTNVACYALRFDGLCGAVCYRIGESEGVVEEIVMTEFDKIFRDRNVNTPLIYVVDVGNVSTETGSYIGIRIPCIEKYIKPESGEAVNSFSSDGNHYDIQKYISNVTHVKIMTRQKPDAELVPTIDTHVQVNEDVFTEALEAFKPSNSGYAEKTFATATQNGNGYTYNKVNYIELTIDVADYAANVFTVTENGIDVNHVILLIEFDYDNDLMDAYINLYESREVNNASFANDFGIIQLISGKNGTP